MRIEGECDLEGSHRGPRLIQQHRQSADAAVDPCVALIGSQSFATGLQRLGEPAALRQDIGAPQKTGREFRPVGSHAKAAVPRYSISGASSVTASTSSPSQALFFAVPSKVELVLNSSYLPSSA